MLDFSQGSNFPIIASLLIDKRNHTYSVCTCADQILEIAIDRTLTETFQGQTLHCFRSRHASHTLNEMPNMPKSHNVLNQLESGSGLFNLEFFCESVSENPCSADFCDLSGKNNKELLEQILLMFKEMGRPVYVRNFSFLGFPCYKIIVPGFSESRGIWLTEAISEYALGDSVHTTFRNVEAATMPDLHLMLAFYKRIQTVYSRVNNFRGLAGLPMNTDNQVLLTSVTLAYAAYKLGNYSDSIRYLAPLLKSRTQNSQITGYFECVAHYLRLIGIHTPKEKIQTFLSKLYSSNITKELFAQIDAGRSPFDAYLLKCDHIHCAQCRYQTSCSYQACTAIFQTLGSHYQAFCDGQNRAHFI